ncbi:Tetratricopeptide repeat family protein [Cryptosporidium meleagridis]|uniref:ER membrane protein complex subunit 2 n=1 Tax=Cryptosporidium meleagridis TaxID=93969 RepID=A0A2P4YWX5_9CRYT|nr:Tetratricopeptide repeat family protein [Cryptosporidium meleagridis]
MGGAYNEQSRNTDLDQDKIMDLKEIKNLSYKELCNQFEKYKALNYVELVILLGTTLILDYNRKLGERKWDVMESIALATFHFGVKYEHDGHNNKISKWQKYCMDELNKKHASTFRYKKLVGMLLESRGEIEKALDVYKQLLKFDPEDLEIRRRVISVLFENNVSLIDEHLRECIMDINAWKMKAYYLLTHTLEYESALYCMEEILLHEPQNIDTINIIADLHLALGNYSKSRQYFCLTLNIQKSNLRALWGILQCNLLKNDACNQNHHNKSQVDDSITSNNERKLTQLAVKQIINICSENYSNSNINKKDIDHDINYNNGNGNLNNNQNKIEITTSMIVSELLDYYTSRIQGL